jgi:hypothetical protein
LSADTPCESLTGDAPGGKCAIALCSTLPGNDEGSADADILVLGATGVVVSPFLPSPLASRSDLERGGRAPMNARSSISSAETVHLLSALNLTKV